MRSVSIAGIGQTPARCDDGRPTSALAWSALQAAIADAGLANLQALYVSSMFCEENERELSGLAKALPGVDVHCAAPACGGGAALHLAVQAVAAGVYDRVAVVGADSVLRRAPAAAPDECAQGLSCIELDALILRRYLYEYSWQRSDLAPFVVNARRQAMANSHAALRTPIDLGHYLAAAVSADPMTVLDSAPVCSGAAAVVLCPSQATPMGVRIAASTIGRDAPALHDRADILRLRAASESAQAAYAQAGVGPQDIDSAELHDSSTIMAVLSLEACGFAEQGEGVRLGADGAIAIGGRLPISTLGGLLGRGDAGAASALYQVVEAVLQLRGQAGAGQVQGARRVLVQSMTGSGACAATHILSR